MGNLLVDGPPCVDLGVLLGAYAWIEHLEEVLPQVSVHLVLRPPSLGSRTLGCRKALATLATLPHPKFVLFGSLVFFFFGRGRRRELFPFWEHSVTCCKAHW